MKRQSVLAAVVVVLLTVYARGFCGTGASRIVSCEPDCTGVVNGDKVADPMNCTAFYYCNGGEAYGPVHCDSGHFDPGAAECVTGNNCIPSCISYFGNCPLTCNDTVQVVGDAFDCSVYYFCAPGQANGPYTCPQDRPYYDGNSFTCVNDESVCCSGYCNPYCIGSGYDLVPDPKNSSMYYVCSNEEGIPGEENHFVCGAGEYFNVQTGACVEGPVADLSPTLCDATTVGANCPLTCNGTLLIADAFNCSAYYHCTPTGPLGPYACPQDRPHYDGNSFTCVNDESVCCSGYCQPCCSGSGLSLVPDPKDCSMYYVCGNEEGIPGEDYHFACDAVGYFNVQAGECVEGSVPDPCPTLCDAASGARKF